MFDELDRKIATALQIDGRAAWHRIARVIDASESTVARRAQRMISSGQIRITGVTDPLRCGIGNPVLIQLVCEVGAAKDVGLALAERGDVRFLSLVTGRFDVVAELVVPSRIHLSGVLLQDLGRIDGVRETTTDTVLRTFKISYDWNRHSLGSGADLLDKGSQLEGHDGRVDSERMDGRLLGLLMENGRSSFAVLASALGVSESMVRRRVGMLVAKGCLRFAALVDPQLLGYESEVLMWLRVHPSELESTATGLAAHREVRYLSATAGYSDLLCECIFRTQDELYEFSTKVLGSMPGLHEVEMGLELETLKRGYSKMRTAEEQDGTRAAQPKRVVG